MKKIIIIAVMLSFVSALSFDAKSTYVVTDHRLNYVKIKEVKESVAESRNMNHPAEISEAQMRGILSSIKLSRRNLIGKGEEKDLLVFNEPSVNFLAPALVKAFRDATPKDEVVFSYLVKDPIFILRNDRINIADLWVSNNELHIKFQKLYAKVTGDIDKKGNFGRAVANAQGLRLDFELGAGQKMGIDDPEELVVDLNHNFSEQEELVAVTTTNKSGASGKKTAADKSENTVIVPADNSTADENPSVEQRLIKLEQLKKDKLITSKEYNEKRKEILKDL